MPKVVSFQVEESGLLKEIFYVIENRNNGDLRLIERHTGWHVDSLADSNSSSVAESRFSIHVTPNNPTHSLIKQTFRAQKVFRCRYIWTDAVKSKTGFIFVFHKVCQLMTDPKYSPKPTAEKVWIGSYDPRFFTLQFSVLVGRLNASSRYLGTTNSISSNIDLNIAD
jgi:hypothetical protein